MEKHANQIKKNWSPLMSFNFCFSIYTNTHKENFPVWGMDIPTALVHTLLSICIYKNIYTYIKPPNSLYASNIFFWINNIIRLGTMDTMIRFIQLQHVAFSLRLKTTKEHIQQKRKEKEKDADYKIQHQHLYDTPKLCNIYIYIL